MDFWKSKEWQELSGLLTTASLPGATVGGQYLGLLGVRTPDGKMVLAAAVFDDICPGSNFIEIKGEKLLAKLRKINGQFHNVPGTGDLPVFYYEYLMSTADFEVFSKTGKLPIVTDKTRPRQTRDVLTHEIMELLIKRQTSLADGIDTLTTVKLNYVKAMYRGARANEFDLLLSHFYEEVRGFSESMKRDRFCWIPKKRSSYTMERDRSKVFKTFYAGTYVRFYSVPVKRIRQRIKQVLAGTILRNKLGHGGGFEESMGDKERDEKVRHLAIEIRELLNKHAPSASDGINALDSVIITAIEATHGREKADEFDLRVARFSKEAQRRLSGVQVQ